MRIPHAGYPVPTWATLTRRLPCARLGCPVPSITVHCHTLEGVAIRYVQYVTPCLKATYSGLGTVQRNLYTL